MIKLHREEWTVMAIVFSMASVAASVASSKMISEADFVVLQHMSVFFAFSFYPCFVRSF